MKNNQLSFVKYFCALLAIVALWGCASKPVVTTDFDATYNFAALKSFSIKETKQDSTADIKISPFTLKQIQSVLGDELSKHFQSVTADASPDFFVSYHLVVEDKLDTRDADFFFAQSYMGGAYRRSPGFYGGAQFGSGIKVFNQGSLIIDFVDAKTLQPIWRGVSEKRLGKGSPQQQREIVTAAVLEVLAQFPPRK